jgi:hypothetical protein
LCKVFNYGEWCWKFVYDFWVKINTLIWWIVSIYISIFHNGN